MTDNMKKVLIITYYWPPTGGSGVQRWVKFAKYLRNFGWEPVIYTPENPEQLAKDDSLIADVPADVEVIRRPIIEPYKLYRKFFRSGDKGAGVNQMNSQKKTFKQRLAVLARGNLFVPDPRVGWVRPSVRFLRKYLKDNPVDAIVTSGPPQSMHLIGLNLKQKTGVRWLADFRDPWTEVYYFKHMGLFPWTAARHRRLEQKVLDNADTIIAVTSYVQADFQARTSTPVELITNGYDQDDFTDTPPVLPADKFTVVHTGIMASDGNPLRLWDVLARKCSEDSNFRKQLRIRLAGPTDGEIFEALKVRGLGDNVDNLGYISHTQTIQEQRSANVLIMPLREEPELAKILPGKIFEYLAARRPILGIGQEKGAVADVLKDAEAGVIYDWDRTEPVRNFIESAWERHLIGEDDAPKGEIAKYSRLELTRKLTEIL